jgi:hypothetical protein
MLWRGWHSGWASSLQGEKSADQLRGFASSPVLLQGAT